MGTLRTCWFGPTVLLLVAASVSAQDEFDTQPLTKPFTTPQQALEKLQLPEGFTATLFAAEPDVRQPIAVATDHRGRLWVVENLTYSDSSTNYDLTQSDRILILEDTDHDGVCDSHTVFWDEGKKVTGIELGFGGVWVTAAPNLLFIPDADGDDRPDGPPQVLLNGFEGDVIRHNIVNGLRWGPDGWLYGRHGIQATSFVGKPDATESERVPMNCAIWRYHPVSHKFEIVAQGGTNPWGFDYDQHGEMFMINTVIGHLFHVVPGARFRRMYGAHFNPHTYQVIEQTADHVHWDTGESHALAGQQPELSPGTDAAGGGHAHTGLMIYQGNQWPEQYHNTLFTANFHGRRLNNDTIHREGNSYVGHHGADFMKTDDPWFRGVEMIYGPDGGVYVLDWSDIGECHENDGIHRSSGRIFKITYGQPKPPQLANLADASQEELVQLMTHPNEWYVRKARRLLQERHARGEPVKRARDALIPMTVWTGRDPDGVRRQLRALWAMHAIGESGHLYDHMLTQASQADSEHVRAWTVRLWIDDTTTVDKDTAIKLVEMAIDDSSRLVRLYLASAIPHLETDMKFLLASALSRHSSDARDRVQPHMIWYGIEPEVVNQWSSALVLALESEMPLLCENIVRRLVTEYRDNPEPTESVLHWLKSDTDESRIVSALTGFNKAVSGWATAPAPSDWEATSQYLLELENDNITQLVNTIGVVFGDGRAIGELKAIATDPDADYAVRRSAIRSWAESRPDELYEVLRQLITDKRLTNAVVHAMVFCIEPQAARVIINRLPHMDPEGRALAINTLVARQNWSLQLLGAVETGRVARGEVTAWHARQMFAHENSELRDRLTDVWGTIKDSPADKQALIDELTESLVNASGELAGGDLSRGRKLFATNCAACHTLYGVGGDTGPDLTGANRDNLNYLLVNMIDPSSSVAESYRASVIELVDGRLVTGLVLETSDQILRVQTLEEIITIDRQDMEGIRVTEKSVMPDGMLTNFSAEQVADLVSYLMSKQQVPLPPAEPGR
ncbi:MAG: PVC-type heme-binding CxxCH protein [Pirellulaceae bacterium]